MQRRRNTKPIIPIAVLAVAALVAAAITFTNYTIWVINATLPPAMKYAGPDTDIANRADGSGYNRYVYVSHYFDHQKGLNITRISIVGFTGDVTNYTRVLRLCNRQYSGTLYAQLHLVGFVDSTPHQGNITFFRVQFEGVTASGGLPFVQYRRNAGVEISHSGKVAIPYGSCVDVGAQVLIDPRLPPSARDGKTVIGTFEVRVHFSTE